MQVGLVYFSGLLDSELIDLVWLSKASIPNFSFLGSLEVAQIYLPGCKSKFKLNLTGTGLGKNMMI